LLFLYSTFSKILQLEKVRVYNDDTNYIYRTLYIKKEMGNLNITKLKKATDNAHDEGKSFVTYNDNVFKSNLFDEFDSEQQLFNQLISDFQIKQLIFLNYNKIDDLKKLDTKPSELSDSFFSYIKTLSIDVSCNYVLIAEYNCEGSICKDFYSWVGVN